MIPTDQAQSILLQDASAVIEKNLPLEKFSGMHVVVTGATGLVGQHLVRSFGALNASGRLERPVLVTALVRNVAKARHMLSVGAAGRHLRIRPWDFNSFEKPHIAGVDLVFHAASNASGNHYRTDPVGTMLPNMVGTLGLLETLGRQSGRGGLVLLSSGEVLTSGETYEPDSERAKPLAEDDVGIVDHLAEASCYAESKRAGEALIAAWTRQFGLNTWAVRLWHTYGPGLRESDKRVFADWVYQVARGQEIVMTSDGTAKRSFTYVTDAIWGLFSVVLLGSSGPYNLANTNAHMSMVELAELLLEIGGKRDLGFRRRPPEVDYVPSVNRGVEANITKMQSLGWQPEVDPRTGFRRTYDYAVTQIGDISDRGI